MARSYKRVLGSRNYANYTETTLKKAIHDVKTKKKTIRQASETYGIPKSTLSDKILGKHIKKYGGQQVLSSKEEKNVVNAIETSATWGFPLTHYDIRKLVQSYLNRKGVIIKCFSENLPGPDWIKSFMKRHDSLSTRLAQNIKRCRAQVTRDIMTLYFTELKKSLEGVSPENVINYDETNFSDDPGRPKVVCKRGSKYCDRIMDSTKTSISVMMAASAAGELLPPFVVYKAKNRYVEWEENGPRGCRYGISSSGWFDSNAFVDWFRQIVIPFFRGKEGPKVMIGDNLSSHITTEVIQTCQEHEIRFVLLPPNTTHLCQPLDVSFFAPLKRMWRKILTDWKLKRRGPFQKSDFPHLLKTALNNIEASSRKNILSGFRACGIVPFNPHPVLKRIPSTSDVQEESNPLLSDSLLTFLQETRSPEPRNTQRRRRIKVQAGKPINVSDLTENKENFPAEEESSDSDVPLISLRNNNNQLSTNTDEDCNPGPDLLPSTSEISGLENDETEEIEDCDNTPIDLSCFVVVKVPIENSIKFKYFCAQITSIDDKSKIYTVKFLKRKVSFKDDYFYFSNLNDQSNIDRSDITKVLRPLALRRERYKFVNLPKDKPIE